MPLVSSDLVPTGYFDGASEEGGLKCGVGAILGIDEFMQIKMKMNCGRSTNTHGGLLALSVLLWVAHINQISNMYVLGDSKVIID